MVFCEASEEYYIGASGDMLMRKGIHLSEMSLKRHRNIGLQECYDEYGIEQLYFIVVEKCEKEKLNERERHWINKFCDGKMLNVKIPVERPSKEKKVIYDY